MKKRNKYIITWLQLTESFIIFYVNFLAAYGFNVAYKVFTGVSPDIYLSVPLFIVPPLLIFTVAKVWYRKYSERHSFVMIILSFLINWELMRQFGGSWDYYLFILNNASWLSKIGYGFLHLIILITEFMVISLISGAVHSLFTDRLQSKGKGGFNQCSL